MADKPLVIGVTGGIGSGKTTLCKEWETEGVRVVYADPLAKELMERDDSVRRQLIETFGEHTYTPDGILNRPHLIREAFEKNRTEELNRIVHPAVRRAFKRICEEAGEKGEKVVAKEAALLLKEGQERPEELDVVVLVLSDRADQIRRVEKRDGFREEDIVKRMEKQPDFDALVPQADYVIRNNGSLEEFKTRSGKLLKKIVRQHN